MKLRDTKKKRVVHNVKKENQKLELALINTCSSSELNKHTTTSTTSSLTIKQEDTKEHKKLLQQHHGKSNYMFIIAQTLNFISSKRVR